MKHALIAFLAAIASISYAELPDTLKDPATKEVIEYLDSKTTKSVNLASDFTNANSTITVSGTIDIGWEIVNTGTSCGSAATCSVTCSTGKKLLGGGCTAGGAASPYLRSTYPSADNAWTCVQSAAAAPIAAYAICARIK